MNTPHRKGRLSILAAALVVARRDFAAILFSRSFIFFLLGPLFPVVVGIMAGGVGQAVQKSTDRAAVGLAMTAADNARMLAARAMLADKWEGRLPALVPALVVVADRAPGEAFDAGAALSGRPDVSAILDGRPEAPVLHGADERIRALRGPVALLAAEAMAAAPTIFPPVALRVTAHEALPDRHGRLVTAQASQTLLFLLTMLLAGMVLSNLVEEKGNKIIEILAAAIPLDALFLGKLFAMLAISFVGIGVWAMAGGVLAGAAGPAMPELPVPAVGWPLFLALGIAYFAMAYLLLGSVFLAVGAMATTVREVQTLSMPATMMQLMVFFLASYAMTQPGGSLELFAIAFPFSSPFSMIARAAQDSALWTHGVALLWQGLCVIVFVRAGAWLFKTRVMKSGPAGRPGARRRLARILPRGG